MQIPGISKGPIKETKVFGIGCNKTGTTSLARALAILGYRVCEDVQTGDYQRALPDRGQVVEEAFSKLSGYDAFEDNPWAHIYEEIDEEVDDSKFILTVRDSEGWIDSMVNYYGTRENPMLEWIYGASCPEGNEERYVEVYESHNQEVLDYFEGRDDLLVLRITEGEGWEKLCPFLREQVPGIDFPHVNARSETALDRKLYDLRARGRYLFRHYVMQE